MSRLSPSLLVQEIDAWLDLLHDNQLSMFCVSVSVAVNLCLLSVCFSFASAGCLAGVRQGSFYQGCQIVQNVPVSSLTGNRCLPILN